MEVGIDICKQMMEITPSMHHMMGGYDITEWGETNIDGLFACGEVTRSVHGANRLGGNSIAEGQVFGRRAGLRASEYARHTHMPQILQQIIDENVNDLETFRRRESGIKTTEILMQIKDVMWNEVGIIRDAEKLQCAQQKIQRLKQEANTLYAHNIYELQSCLEIRDMLKVAEVIILAALERKESRGAHYRSDYPRMDPAWEKNIRVYKGNDGNLATEVVPPVKE
jgi:succinate dehydrogenase/fumarate reductase flavoprotein subunit